MRTGKILFANGTTGLFLPLEIQERFTIRLRPVF